jgi:hypothetical protein
MGITRCLYYRVVDEEFPEHFMEEEAGLGSPFR